MKKAFTKGFSRKKKDTEAEAESQPKPKPKVIPEDARITLDPHSGTSTTVPSAQAQDESDEEKETSTLPSSTQNQKTGIPVEESANDSLLGNRCPPPPPPSNRPAFSAMQSEASERIVFKDSPQIKMAYDAVPVLEQNKLPRGGVSIETKAVGRVQVSRKCWMKGNPFRFAFINTHFILLFSLAFHRKRSRIACGWVYPFHRCILCQSSVSVERWALHWVSIWLNSSFLPISTFLFTRNGVRWWWIPNMQRKTSAVSLARPC
jgi:hypothetical protein